MRALLVLISLAFGSPVVVAQRVHAPDLFHCLTASASDFEACMFKQGFVCYMGQGGLNGWTCCFAYQPTPFRQAPDKASALIQYDRNSRSDILTYQVRTKKQYEKLCQELLRMGYRLDPVVKDRQLFASAKVPNTVVTCQPATTTTGMSGNYEGYQFTLTHRRY